MSDSRLEKFIYAICSMEVSDLPAPLSRIEILWNCLITGETPDFEPLSRNEKYLMAMLDRYDISNLPAPMSRGEKLLYKIAVGETDLSDVPDYLSRYEELLKYLIENGGISGGDFEYVLYTLNQSLSTLYNTAEKPVKSAILKGQTLVNIVQNQFPVITWWDNTGNNSYFKDSETAKLFKPDTDYLFIFEGADTITLLTGVGTFFTTNNNDISGKKLKLRTLSELSSKTFIPHFKSSVGGSLSAEEKASIRFMIIEYQDGMENWDIPYFEGMQSVKTPVLTTTGKNLSPINDYETTVWEYEKGHQGFNKVLAKNILVNENKEYRLSFTKECEDGLPTNLGNIRVQFSSIPVSSNIDNDNSVYRYCQNNKGRKYAHITMPNIGQGTEYIGKRVTLTNIQLEEGSVKTSYEPHKTNILTVNEDVKLRGIGDVQDTLDLMTGEVTERIGEIVLDGSQKMVLNHTLDDVLGFYMESKIVGSSYLKYLMCDKLPVKSIYNVNEEGIRAIGGDSPFRLYFTISKSKLSSYDVDGLNNYLKQNPITVHYRLITESIKTVDLTTVDQDGQPTKLKTFNDITHVEIKADNVIPSVDVEVATKISETLAALDQQQLDISNTQNKLGQTIDEQTENTDATMMATTEIYEQTL